MTVPNGHPDYQDYPVWRSGNLLPTFSDSLGAGTTTYGPFVMTHWSAVSVRAFVSSGNGVFKVNWWADQAMTQGLGAESFEISASTSLLTSLPVAGPYMSIAITAGPVTPLILNHWVMGSNNNPGRPIFPVVTDQVTALASSVPASTTFNLHPGWIVAGWSYLYFRPLDVTGKLSVEIDQIDKSGVTQARLYGPVLPTTQITQQFIAPGHPIQVQIINTDGAGAHSFDLNLLQMSNS
jgi:hypothetical protein